MMPWLMTTRGRPDACRDLIAAMAAVNDTPRVIVMIDDDPFTYDGVPWPEHWEIHVSPEHMEMTRALNTLVGYHPGAPFYGFFGDHFRPRTPWSAELEAAAGDWCIAWPMDEEGLSVQQPSAAPCFGGRLVSALGWICLPTTVHHCTDRVWWHLWKALGNCKVVETVVAAHNGARMKDLTYRGRRFPKDDYQAWCKWRDTEAPAIVESLRAEMGDISGCTPFREGW